MSKVGVLILFLCVFVGLSRGSLTTTRWTRQSDLPNNEKAPGNHLVDSTAESDWYYWFNVTVTGSAYDPYVRVAENCGRKGSSSREIHLVCLESYHFELGVTIEPQDYDNELLESTDLAISWTDDHDGVLEVVGYPYELEVTSSGVTFVEYVTFELCSNPEVECYGNITYYNWSPSTEYVTSDPTTQPVYASSYTSESPYSLSITTVSASLSSSFEISSSDVIAYEASVPDDLDESYPYEITISMDGCQLGCASVDTVYFDGAYGCIATTMSTTLVALRCSSQFGFQLMATVTLSDTSLDNSVATAKMPLVAMDGTTYYVANAGSGVLIVDGDCPDTAASGEVNDVEVVVGLSLCLELAGSTSYWWILLVVGLLGVIFLVLVVMALAYWKRDLIKEKLTSDHEDDPKYQLLDEDV